VKKAKLLDSYAILAWLQDEPDADKVNELLEKAQMGELDLYMNWINMGEVYYQIWRRKGRQIALETMTELQILPITFISATNELVLEAAGVKAEYPIAYADCFAIATARYKKASLVTGNPEFKKVKGLVTIEWME